MWDFGGGDTTSQIFSPVRTYTTPGTYYVSLLIQDSICNTIDTAFQTIVVDPPVTVSGGNTYTTCEDTITLSINTTGPINQIVWSTNNQFTDTLNNNPLDSSLLINLNDTVWYYVMASNNECFGVDSFLINYPGFSIQTLNNTICEGEQITLIGDSVGGTLVTTLTQRLIQNNDELSNKILLISPVMDATMSNKQIDIVDQETVDHEKLTLVELYGVHIPVLEKLTHDSSKVNQKLFWPFTLEQVTQLTQQ